METTNVRMTAPVALGWLSGRRGLIIAITATAAALALAAAQHWLVLADLVPLLFVLPCAMMMLKCIKGTSGGEQTSTTQASVLSDTPTPIDMRD